MKWIETDRNELVNLDQCTDIVKLEAGDGIAVVAGLTTGETSRIASRLTDMEADSLINMIITFICNDKAFILKIGEK